MTWNVMPFSYGYPSVVEDSPSLNQGAEECIGLWFCEIAHMRARDSHIV
jgi:hypothetical protein